MYFAGFVVFVEAEEIWNTEVSANLIRCNSYRETGCRFGGSNSGKRKQLIESAVTTSIGTRGLFLRPIRTSTDEISVATSARRIFDHEPLFAPAPGINFILLIPFQREKLGTRNSRNFDTPGTPNSSNLPPQTYPPALRLLLLRRSDLLPQSTLQPREGPGDVASGRLAIYLSR